VQGVRKILRAFAIVVLPVVATVIIFGSSSGVETAIGWALNSLAAAVAAFLLGNVLRWLWW